MAIAASQAGARRVTAADIDPNAIVAARINAEANGISLDAFVGDLLDAPVS